jgi:hypothetical protein
MRLQEAPVAELLSTFREKAGGLIAAINDRGGISATIEALRRQMAEADRRRMMTKVKSELKRLDRQITEMTTAVGVQAVGLHRAGKLRSRDLQPLCEHIVELEEAVEGQKARLAALKGADQAAQGTDTSTCTSCNRPLMEGATFCAHCGAQVPEADAALFCIYCGAAMRPGARFCQRCGQAVPTASDQ